MLGTISGVVDICWSFILQHDSTGETGSKSGTPKNRWLGLHRAEYAPIAFNKVLQACSGARRWQQALAVVSMMSRGKVGDTMVWFFNVFYTSRSISWFRRVCWFLLGEFWAQTGLKNNPNFTALVFYLHAGYISLTCTICTSKIDQHTGGLAHCFHPGLLIDGLRTCQQVAFSALDAPRSHGRSLALEICGAQPDLFQQRDCGLSTCGHVALVSTFATWNWTVMPGQSTADEFKLMFFLARFWSWEPHSFRI